MLISLGVYLSDVRLDLMETLTVPVSYVMGGESFVYLADVSAEAAEEE